jgi:hypothetical protein
MAAASATVASFMAVFFLFVFRDKCGESIDRLQRTFSSRLFNLARLAGSFLPFTGIEQIITRKTARQKNRRASLSVLACPARNCLQYGNGGSDCSFTSKAQCEATASGQHADCFRNYYGKEGETLHW